MLGTQRCLKLSFLFIHLLVYYLFSLPLDFKVHAIRNMFYLVYSNISKGWRRGGDVVALNKHLLNDC